MTLGRRGPQARANELSYLRELTTAQLQTYTAEQLITIAETVPGPGQNQGIDHSGKGKLS